MQLIGCSVLTPLNPIQIDLPAELASPCKPLSKPPHTGALTQLEVEELWEQDRGNLLECTEKVKGLQAILTEL